ncbi:hypothetical protein PQR62_15690 [Herbaspirillum lusitanum]|jgi:hypothetical protein|uniref:Uncharacterized protein n=1 Tax=Herbaspirillum lusitanum TaxID=213312 RepID=A0ABW9AD56_9BURK
MELHFLARDAYRDGGMKAGRRTNDAAPKKETNKQTNKQTNKRPPYPALP